MVNQGKSRWVLKPSRISMLLLSIFKETDVVKSTFTEKSKNLGKNNKKNI